MSTAVWAAQKALASALTDAGLPTSPEVPEKGVAPLRYVLNGGLTFGPQKGSWTLALRIVHVAKNGTNEVMAERLWDLAAETINALTGLSDEFAIAPDTVDEPAEIKLNGQLCLAAAVNVTAHISRAQMKG